jgi:hypothetical protein
MAQLYLPVDHTEGDLVLAGQIAELMDSAELYVAWTPEHGPSVPEVLAVLRAPAPHWFGLFFQAMREIWAALRNREGTRAPLALPPGGEHATQPKPAG